MAGDIDSRTPVAGRPGHTGPWVQTAEWIGQDRAPNELPSARTVDIRGLPGAQVPLRFAGATLDGPPTSGTWKTSDVVLDVGTAEVYVCIAGGTPGTWRATSNEVGPVGASRIGSDPPAGTPIVRQSGTVVHVTDANGAIQINYPTPFLHGVHSFVVGAGDTLNGPFVVMAYEPNAALDHDWVICYDMAGAPLANVQVRIEWTAAGW